MASAGFALTEAANNCSGIQRTLKTKAPAPSTPFRNPRRLLPICCSFVEMFSIWIISPHSNKRWKEAKGCIPSWTILPPSGNLANPACLGRGPVSLRAPQIHELPQMIGVMVRQHQRLAQDRLAIAMRDFCVQIRFWILHQVDHFLQVALESLYGFVPRSVIRRHGRLRPVAFRESG